MLLFALGVVVRAYVQTISMGKSAKFTRGGNKHRVNVGRLKAKIERHNAGATQHTAVQDVLRRGGQQATAQQVTASLKAIQAVRQQKADGNVAVRMVQRQPAKPAAVPDAAPPAAPAAPAPAPQHAAAGKKKASAEVKKVRKTPKQ